MIPLFPDFLANASGVPVICCEWVQNQQQCRWAHDQLKRELRADDGSSTRRSRGLTGRCGLRNPKDLTFSDRRVRDRVAAGMRKGGLFHPSLSIVHSLQIEPAHPTIHDRQAQTDGEVNAEAERSWKNHEPDEERHGNHRDHSH